MLSDPFKEIVLDDQTLFTGKILELHHQRVQLPSGGESTREIVRHAGAVAVLAEPEPNQLLFVEQYRSAPGEVLLELPAGKLDPNEAPMDCAKRELEEETGYRASCWSPLFEFFTSPGFADEKIWLYHATDLRRGTMHLDEDEFLNVHVFSRDEVIHRVTGGGIRDAKTLIGVLWWLRDPGSTW